MVITAAILSLVFLPRVWRVTRPVERTTLQQLPERASRSTCVTYSAPSRYHWRPRRPSGVTRVGGHLPCERPVTR
jgi:hypothetical protein